MQCIRPELTECLTYRQWHATQHRLQSRNPPHGKASTAIGHAQGIYQLFSHHPKVAGTTELWNGPLKTHERTVLCRAGWDKVFHKATHTPNQRCSFLKARLHRRSRSQGVGKGVAPFITTRCDSLAKFAASARGLCSAGQEILLSKGKMFPLEGRTTASSSWKLRLPVTILELSYL